MFRVESFIQFLTVKLYFREYGKATVEVILITAMSTFEQGIAYCAIGYDDV